MVGLVDLEPLGGSPGSGPFQVVSKGIPPLKDALINEPEDWDLGGLGVAQVGEVILTDLESLFKSETLHVYAGRGFGPLW